MSEAEKLMTRAEVAAYLDVPAATLARWAMLKQGPRYATVGRHVRYRPSEVEKWLDHQSTAPAA